MLDAKKSNIQDYNTPSPREANELLKQKMNGSQRS